MVVTFLLTMDFLIDYLELFLGKGIPLSIVLKLFFLGLGWMLALSVPCGVLVGVLMTYGRLSQDNEIVALKASGVSPFRAIVPSVVASVCLAAALAMFNNYALPDMNYAFANLMVDVNKRRPTAEIQEGVFIDHFDGYSLFIGTLDSKSGRMEDVLIYDFSRRDEAPRTVLAKRGHLEFDEQTAVLKLHLQDGEIHQASKEASPIYRKLAFQQQTLNIRGVREALARTRDRSRGQREMPIGAMKIQIRKLEEKQARYAEKSQKALEKVGVGAITDLPGMEPDPPWFAPVLGFLGWEPEPQPALPDSFWTKPRRRHAEEAKTSYMQVRAAAKKISQFRVEIHKKFSIPFACIVFVLVGAPLGIRARRGGLAAGFFSVGFFVFYYLCLVGGEQLADRERLPPWLSMWFANILLGSLGIGLILHVCQVTLPWQRARGPGVR
jgi:lipopolysaccharide export system permease protein